MLVFHSYQYARSNHNDHMPNKRNLINYIHPKIYEGDRASLIFYMNSCDVEMHMEVAKGSKVPVYEIYQLARQKKKRYTEYRHQKLLRVLKYYRELNS